MNDQQRRLAAIMFTDIVGYTTLSQKNEVLTLELLGEHRRLLRPLFPKHGGHEIKTTGDGFLVEFSSALQATRCALEIQKALNEQNALASPERRIQIRIGIHVGEVVHRESDLFGNGVNIASRIEPLAEPGGICLSQQAYDQVRNKIEAPLVSLGKKELKNVQLPMEVYQMVLPWEKKSPEELPLLGKSRIAVLPLANISPDPKDEYFTDGMTEELIYTLSKVGGLKVIAQTSVMKYKGIRKSVAEIGQELKVGTVLEGSVRKADNRVRITAQLVDVRSEEHLWSQAYDRELEDVFAIQSDVAQQVAKELEVKLLGREKEQIEKKATGNPEAYDSYLLGHWYWNRRTEEGLRKAIEHFEQAIEKDPDYAVAYAGLADSYSLLASYGFLLPQEGYPRAREAALKALEIDDTLAEAHTSLGLIKWEYDRDIEGAEEEFKLARKLADKLNPNYATVHHWYALLLRQMGRTAEALAEIRRAVELDPLSPIINAAAAGTFEAVGRFSEAIERYHKALEIDPNFIYARLGLAGAKQLSWDWEGAEEELKQALEIDPSNATAHSFYAYHSICLGRVEEGLAEIQRALELNPSSIPISTDVGILLCLARQYDQAIEQLQKALEMDPNNEKAHLFLGLAYVQKPIYGEGLAEFQKAEELSGGFNQLLDLYIEAYRGITYARMGKKDRAREALDDLMERPKQTDLSSAIALLYFAVGEKEQGFQWLEKAYEEHDPLLLTIKIHPLLDDIRSNPRYKALLRKMGLEG